MTFQYPPKSIDQPATLLSYLGSHWQSVYHAQRQIASLMLARGRIENQRVIELDEAIGTVSRLNLPDLVTQQWTRMVFKQSDVNRSEHAITLRYGEPVYLDQLPVYGTDPRSGTVIRYGEPAHYYYSLPLPDDLKDVPFVANRITSPSLMWTKNLDYLLNDGVITFRTNPFENDLIPQRPVYDGDTITDYEIELWFHRTHWDDLRMQKHFGFVAGFALPSSQNYNDLVNAVLDGITEGGAGGQLQDAFAAICDIPVVQDEEETVEHVLTDARHLLIITDRRGYRFPKDATAIVAVGDTVRAGGQLVDTVEFIEFHDGTVPDDLLGIELEPGMLAGDYYGGIAFENTEKDLAVDTSGIFTYVSWEVGGWPQDVQQFWDSFHARGVANPPTLAQLLDVRETPPDEPSAASLPATVNPLKFLAENVLRNNAFVVRIKHNRCGPNALSLNLTRYVRQIVPPHTHMIVVVELAPDEETITMDGIGDEITPGFEEDPELTRGLEPITEDMDGSTFVTGDPTLAYTSGQCV
jgi:hypothetical protein